jgi:hypothetical protein
MKSASAIFEAISSPVRRRMYYHLNRAHLASNTYDFLVDFCPQSRISKRKSKEAAKAQRKKNGGAL